MKKKYILLFMLSSSLIQSSPSPILPPALYIALRTQNPAALCANLGFIFYQFVSGIFNAPPQLPTLSKTPSSPDTTVIAFDLHDVIFTPNYAERIKIIAGAPHKFTLFKHAANPVFLYHALRLTTQQIAAEQVLDLLLPRYPDLNLFLPTIVEAINAQIPIQGTVALMNKLKQRGFKLYLLSNIGDRVLHNMMQKFPTIFDLFDELFFCSQEYNYIRKPNPKFYQFFLEKFNLKATQVIFVDDLVKNISAADRMGMYGILFDCPEQLEKELRTLAIAL